MKKIIFLFYILLISLSTFSQTDSAVGKQNSINIFKFNFFSPLSGHAMLSYEKGLSTRRSQEFSISIIGVGKNMNTYYDPQSGNISYNKKQLGVSLGYGLRYYMPRNISNRKNRQIPYLSGFYFKPTVYGNFFNGNPDLQDGIALNNEVVLSGAILMETGWQAIIGKVFSIDLYGGFGYSAINIDYKTFASQGNFNSALGSNNNWRQYTYNRFGRTVGLALSVGFRVGVVSGEKKVLNKK